MRLAWLLCACLPLAWATDPGKLVTLGRGYDNGRIPIFEHGYMLFHLEPNRYEVWGPDGALRFSGELTEGRVGNLGASASGVVAVGYATISDRGFVLLDARGQRIRRVATGEYHPAHFCFDAHGDLWTFGWGDEMMFRKYSAAGDELGRFGPRSMLLAGGLEPGGLSRGPFRLQAAGDRIGAMAYSGRSGGNMVWVELALDGRWLGKWNIGRMPDGGLAFTAQGELARQVANGVIDVMDRESGQWKARGTSPARGVLLGAAGEQLVFSRNLGTVELSYAPLP